MQGCVAGRGAVGRGRDAVRLALCLLWPMGRRLLSLSGWAGLAWPGLIALSGAAAAAASKKAKPDIEML